MVKDTVKIDYIRGKKYTSSSFRYYLNIRLKETMPHRVLAIVEIGIRVDRKHSEIIYYSVNTEFTRVNGLYKIKPNEKLAKLISERFIIRELFKKIEYNLN